MSLTQAARPRVRVEAFAAGGLNALGLVLAVVGMRPGAPMLPLDQRMVFLAAHPVGWTLGWTVWLLAALALVLLFARLVRVLPGALAVPALALAAIGATIDITCDVLQIIAIPLVAAAEPPAPALFAALDAGLWGCGVILGSGLYCAAVALATLGLARRRHASRLLVASATATSLGGIVWVAAEVGGARAVLEPITGLTVGAFILWTLALGAADGRPRC
jgi:hypothetical protein